MLISCIKNDWHGISERVGNVFEQFIEVADRAVIKSVMRKYDCLCCCMSGSGPSVYGIFADKNKAISVAEKLGDIAFFAESV
jgi:4-diphosphocytidyl-2-C-methyl-D-erythritol kinase